MRTLYLRQLLLLVGVLLAPNCLAERLQVPISLDHHFIESLLREQVFTGEKNSLRLNDDGSGCQYLTLSQPRVNTRGGRAFLRARGEARSGRAVGGRCLLLLDWRGELEFTQEVLVGDDNKSILLKTTSWRVLELDGTTAVVSTTIGGWLEQFLPVTLKQTRISFAQPIKQLENFLAGFASPSDMDGKSTMLGSLAIDGVSAGGGIASVTLGMDVPSVGEPEQRAESALTGEEIARLEERLDAVDAFFTYTIKSVSRGAEPQDPTQLLEVLMQLRRDLVAILIDPQHRADDPARSLFVDAWEGLAPILQVIAEQQSDSEQALRYLTFMSAGDVLRALDHLGPAAGIEVSSDGLRRLARILIPDDAEDPLQHGEGVDPELRKSLGFGVPLPPPQAFNDASFNGASFDHIFGVGWFFPRAVATAELDSAVVKKLNNWVPKSGDMDVYLPMVRDVLRYVVAEQLRANELKGEFHNVFRWLVFAAAWQESCWRQFVAQNDKRVPMRSGSGDIGMMQINPKVWRGLYDLQGLRWDIVYNARAGADILEHHMINYAIRKGEHQTTGAIDSLARSAYAAYNGGPRQYNRYRRADASARGKKVDALFYDKYRQVRSGKELAVAACF